MEVLADAYEQLHRQAHGCEADNCDRRTCAGLAAERGPGWHRKVIVFPEAAVLFRAYGRLHYETHGCPLANCTRPPCAALAGELVPGHTPAVSEPAPSAPG